MLLLGGWLRHTSSNSSALAGLGREVGERGPEQSASLVDIGYFRVSDKNAKSGFPGDFSMEHDGAHCLPRQK